MRILVTGNAGFIGFHLCKKFLERGDYVVGIDNINHYYDIKLKRDRLNILKKNFENKYKFFKVDILNKQKIFRIFKKYKFDRVVHLAAQAGIRKSIVDPEIYVKSNLLGFFNVIEASNKFKIPHFIYASSSSVYGENLKIPFSESDIADKPKQIYAATKKSNELIAYSYSSLYKLKTTGLRFFTVFGPWGRPDMAIYKFTKRIIEKKKIDIYNYGNHVRDLSYIDDVINLTTLATDDINFKNEKTPHRIFNLGGGSPIKLKFLVNTIENILNIKCKKNYLSLQKGDMVKTHSNSKKILRFFNYKIKPNNYKNIKKFIDWYLVYYNK